MEGQPAEPELEPAPPPRDRRQPTPRPSRRARPGKLIVLWALVVAAVFFIGLVIGKALEDAPAPGGTQTLVRTLEPSTVGPALTVTVTEP